MEPIVAVIERRQGDSQFSAETNKQRNPPHSQLISCALIFGTRWEAEEHRRSSGRTLEIHTERSRIEPMVFSQ